MRCHLLSFSLLRRWPRIEHWVYSSGESERWPSAPSNELRICDEEVEELSAVRSERAAREGSEGSAETLRGEL